jgi:hypothetical protein
MVYSAIETTYFGLYLSSSVFYNIKTATHETTKVTDKGVLPKRGRTNTIARSGLKVYAAPRRIRVHPSPHRRSENLFFFV